MKRRLDASSFIRSLACATRALAHSLSISFNYYTNKKIYAQLSKFDNADTNKTLMMMMKTSGGVTERTQKD